MAKSPKHNVEKELRQARQRTESILGGITGCFFLDKDWRFLHINMPGQGYLPNPREELFGKTLWQAYPH